MLQKIREHERVILIWTFIMILVVMGVFCLLRKNMKFTQYPKGTYYHFDPDESKDDPLAYIGDDFEVLDGFHTNLPIVIMSLDSELPDYKTFRDATEILFDGVDAYTTGNLSVIDSGKGYNTPKDAHVYDSLVKVKRKGHSSYSYDKKQYKIKAVNPDGTSNKTDILGMGEGSEWIINGSMADKSMIRNYLPYRIASEIDGNNMAPDSRYCEVMMEENGKLYYQGVFLLMETISQGEKRVNIDEYNPKNTYSSYIVRRDRKTSFDIMLNTYGREADIVKGRESQATDNWIGLKYPGESKVTQETIDYITKDFSQIEKVLYTDDESLFRVYDRYIDMRSFADYFLINEFFGNYDAGEHSTYMHKNSGDVLYMGPVWDYDQALNNSQMEELNPDYLAFQTQTFFAELCDDKRFVRYLKKRYSTLRAQELSEEHIYDVIDETVDYLRSAQTREWYRWAADYYDNSFESHTNYYLQPYLYKGVLLDRFNTDYQEEIYVIKNYIHHHGGAIQPELSGVLHAAKKDTTVGGIRELMFIAMITLVLLPSYLIQRKG
ncbi:MAG: CotH kinase family protein [Butyrivibrio sp.]|nr:CotH kinase family protein [Butyrivibrio sp.]